MNQSIFKFSIFFLFVILFLQLVSAPFGYNNRDLVILREGTLEDLTDVDTANPPTDGYVLTYNATSGQWYDESMAAVGDTNETTRFNALVGNCSAGDFILGISPTGIRYCDTPAGSGITWAEATNGTLVQLLTLLGFNYYNSTNPQPETDPHWSSNYSIFNNTWSSITNTSYYLVTNPFSFYNSTTIGNQPNTNNYWNSTFATFNKTYADTLYSTINEPLWTDNFTKYNTSWSSTTNTSYALVSEPLWTTNFTLYNASWSAGGLTWAEAVNGTLFTTALFNANYSANDVVYRSITNTSYYLVTNPLGFWNNTFATFNKTYADTLYDPLGGSEVDPLWTGNYTAYNTSWSSTYNATYDVYNSTGFIRDWNESGYIRDWNASGLIKSWEIASEVDPYWTDNFTKYNATWSSITNTSYYLVSNLYGYLNTTINTSYYLAINPFSFYNVTTIGNLPNTNNYWNITFATFNKTYADTLYSTIDEPHWTDNFTKYNATWSVGGLTWAEVVNGTMLSQADFDTNYSTLFTQALYNANYSANDEAYRGAINTSYMLITSWNINYSTNDALWRSITNTSYYLATNPFSFYNSTTIGNLPNTNNYWNTTFANFNKTYADTLYYALTNPYAYWNSTFATFNKTYADTLYDPIGGSESDPLWTANYSLYNSSWSSITNTSYYLVTNPFGFWNNTFATFNKTYADTLYSPISEPLWSANYTLYNTSWSSITNTSYLEKAGGTMTGNLNMSSNNITFTNGTSAGRTCYNQACTSYIYNNGSGIIIKG